MLTPDEQFALDILDALDSRRGPDLHPVLNSIGKDERWRLEERRRMVNALLDWLERWMANPGQEHLRSKGDPLWQAVATVCNHLSNSQYRLQQRVEEMDEATERLWEALCQTRGANQSHQGYTWAGGEPPRAA